MSSATTPASEQESGQIETSSSSRADTAPNTPACNEDSDAPPSQALLSLMEDSNASYMEAGDSVVVQSGTAAMLLQGQAASSVSDSAVDKAASMLMPHENSFMPGEASHFGTPFGASGKHKMGPRLEPTVVTVHGEEEAVTGTGGDKDSSGKSGRGTGKKRGPYKRTQERLAQIAKAEALKSALLFGTDDAELKNVLAPAPTAAISSSIP